MSIWQPDENQLGVIRFFNQLQLDKSSCPLYVPLLNVCVFPECMYVVSVSYNIKSLHYNNIMSPKYKSERKTTVKANTWTKLGSAANVKNTAETTSLISLHYGIITCQVPSLNHLCPWCFCQVHQSNCSIPSYQHDAYESFNFFYNLQKKRRTYNS